MNKIVIANRGEIALRIIKTCKRLGISTVAVYSDADIEMPFVKLADESFRIGPPPVQQSYLKADEIIAIAIQTGADAIHPGYGLLSENADFARKVQQSGLRFIGPKADTIEKMGDKIGSRKTMKRAGVPVVPGTEMGVATIEEALEAAYRIGFPIMLKASAGGGGIGMVRCETEQALSQHFESVKKRAKAYFGDDVVFLEKYISNARHIEVQIFGDRLGNVVHLFERNCSVQRRNQKVIEESPSPYLPADAREKLYEAAVNAARAVSYENAGTVEFIVDENNTIYFLEMNTRLQVEHPVTEAITGFDLVEWQIRIAEGKELPVKEQASIKMDGHAIEYRIYAEDPLTFMPSPGTLTKLDWGDTSDIRIDTGFEEGDKITPFYDPLIAKIIVHASSRKQAIERSGAFISSVHIEGLKSNLSLFKDFLKTEEFLEGAYTTTVLPQWLKNKKGV